MVFIANNFKILYNNPERKTVNYLSNELIGCNNGSSILTS